MEIRDYAERVLFATALEDKLRIEAGPVTDLHPGPAVGEPDAPGRPPALRMSPEGERDAFPAEGELDSEESRGRLLHFLANHELLAAELMALVLLRFPDAPAAFREGVFRTLQEEQMHTRLYLRRMEACGVAFGSRPVNRFFWKYVAPMEDPVDYVTRLSLTFEQANLDYARHFSSVFARAGDDASARLLERIYRDEIGHVGYGLQWFRRWKPGGLSDWEAFRVRLPFPLSPSRAKGHVCFNRAGRLAAGLEPAFIDRLAVFEQSRGRTPDVHVFNPGAEWEAAGRTPDRAMRVLAAELDVITLHLARRDDIALVERPPSLAFLDRLRAAGWALPEIRRRDEPPPAERRIHGVSPWGWSPAVDREMSGWSRLATRASRPAWRPTWRDLYSKAFSTAFRERLLADPSPGVLPLAESGEVCRDGAAVRAACARHRERGYRQSVVKAVFGVAGRGMIVEEGPGRADGRRPWEAWLERDGVVVVEPWHERVLDFSVHFDAGSDGLRWRGATRLHNDAAGRFLACSVERGLAAGESEELRRFVHAGEGLLALHRERVASLLAVELRARGFTGPVSIDAMVVRRPDGCLAHVPVVEINPRRTMGSLTRELAARRAARDRRVVFEILTRSRLARRGVTDFPAWVREEEARLPREHAPAPRGPGKLRRGFVCLNDATTAEACLAVLRVGDTGWRSP